MPLNVSIGPARTAGLVYLVVVVTGFLSLAYVPSQLFVYSDAAKTVENIRASEELFRIGIAAGFVCYTAFLLLAFALYRLLGNTNNHAAILMVALVIAGVPVSLGSMISELNVLTLVSGAAPVQGFATDQLNESVMLSLVDYRNEILIAKIFWGLWLLPFGYLVFKSGILPRVLGVLLIVGCFGYLIDVFGRTLFTEYSASRLAGLASKPAALGEIGTCLWLLTRGARNTPRSVG
jgi:hypothetical protein